MNYNIVNIQATRIEAAASFGYMGHIISFSTILRDRKVGIFSEDSSKILHETDTVEEAIHWVEHQCQSAIDSPSEPVAIGEYGEQQVLESAAGFYIGTLFTHNEHSDTPGLVEPGSRDSHYFGTKEEAQACLKYHTS